MWKDFNIRIYQNENSDSDQNTVQYNDPDLQP